MVTTDGFKTREIRLTASAKATAVRRSFTRRRKPDTSLGRLKPDTTLKIRLKPDTTTLGFETASKEASATLAASASSALKRFVSCAKEIEDGPIGHEAEVAEGDEVSDFCQQGQGEVKPGRAEKWREAAREKFGDRVRPGDVGDFVS